MSPNPLEESETAYSAVSTSKAVGFVAKTSPVAIAMLAPRVLSLAAAMLSAAVGTADALDRNQWPVAPRSATTEDCRQLDIALYSMANDASQSYGLCLRQEPRFGNLPSAGGHCEPKGLTAWIQCVDLQRDACEASQFHDQEMVKCRGYAQQNAGSDSKEQLVTALDLAKLNQLDARFQFANKAYELQAAYINSPQKFLFKALQLSNKQLLGKMFPGLTGRVGVDDDKLAEQVYKLAYNRATTGLKPGSNSVISELQGASLRQIDFLYGDIFRQLDTAIAQMKAFDAAARAVTFEAPPPVPGKKGEGSRDCAVLDDFAAARALQDRDPARFIALTRRCKG